MNTQKSTLLFVPALEDRFWKNLLDLAPDVRGFIIDLEDSIHPKAKDRARERVEQHIEVLHELGDAHDRLEIILRINNSDTDFYGDDVELAGHLVDQSLITGLMYPKLETVSEIERLATSVDTETVFLFPIIETLAGYENYDELLSAEFGVQHTAIGAEDLCADMDIERPSVFYSNPLLHQISVDVALRAKMEGIHLWGNIWPYLTNSELLPDFYDEIVMDQQFGATGKIVFHPYQIDVVNNIFGPAHRHEAKKRVTLGRLKAISQRSEECGLSVSVHNGRMVDMPEFVRLKRWLEKIEDPEMEEEIRDMFPLFRSRYASK